MTDDFYTAEEVANLLKLSKYTIYEMIKRGELPAVKVGRQVRISRNTIDALLIKNNNDSKSKKVTNHILASSKPSMFIGSHDLAVESVINQYNKDNKSALCIPAYVGSMEGLLSLYYDRADIAGSHLFDEETATYNIPIVKRLFPGEQMVIVHFVKRNIGWIVPKGNPKNLTSWSDVGRGELQYVNRQKGSGTRVLLDYYMKKFNYSSDDMSGYEIEEATHSGVAGLIARGAADYGLGTESAARALGLDFVFLAQEQYDFIMKKPFHGSEQWEGLRECMLSSSFKQKFSQEGYDLSEIGTTWEE